MIKILYNYLHQLIDFFQKRNSSIKSGGEEKTSSRDLMATTEREILNTPAEIAISPILTSGEQMQAVLTPQQHYTRGMEDIWEKVHQLPKGQDQVVLSQLCAFGKSSGSLDPKGLPALAAHGFIIERPVEDQEIWEPYSPYLKDFWRIGIDVSVAYGFRLPSYRAFQASLSAIIQMTFN